jgi:protease I
VRIDDGPKPRNSYRESYMRALILTGNGVQDQEFIYPYYRLQEAGYEVTVAAKDAEQFKTIGGLAFGPDIGYPPSPGKWDLLVIPGGVKAMEHMRQDKGVVRFVAEFHASGKMIAAICSAPLLLISAGLVKGRRLTCYPAWREDIENAGGEWIDAPAVCDDRIITAPHYRNLGDWMSLTLQARCVPEWVGLCEGA